MTSIEAGACVQHGDIVQLADENGRWRVDLVQGRVLHIECVTSHVVTSVSVDAVASVEPHPGGGGS